MGVLDMPAHEGTVPTAPLDSLVHERLSHSHEGRSGGYTAPGRAILIQGPQVKGLQQVSGLQLPRPVDEATSVCRAASPIWRDYSRAIALSSVGPRSNSVMHEGTLTPVLAPGQTGPCDHDIYIE